MSSFCTESKQILPKPRVQSDGLKVKKKTGLFHFPSDHKFQNVHGYSRRRKQGKEGGRAKCEIEKQKKEEVKEGEAGDQATNLKLRTEKQQQLGRSKMTSEQIFQKLYDFFFFFDGKNFTTCLPSHHLFIYLFLNFYREDSFIYSYHLLLKF